MNLENAKLFVSQMERLPDEKFDMSVYVIHGAPGCGTVACLAGWCSILNGGPTDHGASSNKAVFDFAERFLGLSTFEAAGLFCNRHFGAWANLNREEFAAVTRSQAVDALKKMIDDKEKEMVANMA